MNGQIKEAAFQAVAHVGGGRNAARLGGLRFAEVADDECHLTWGEHFCRWAVAASFQSLDELCVTLYPVHQVGGGGMYGATVGKVEHGKLGLAVGLDSELVHTLFCFFDET